MSDLRGPGSSMSHQRPDGPVDLNTASEEELAAVPGIGAGRARRIVNWRLERGPFRAVEDLQHIPDIGQRGLTEIKEQLKVTASSA